MAEDPELPKPDPALEEAVGVYLAFMEEIKARLAMVELCIDACRETPPVPQAYMHAEFGFLQLRFVCDLVALGALAIHHPYGLTDELLESWHARRALSDLSAINKEGFPRPANVNRGPNGIEIVMKDGLTRNGIQRMFDKCGKALHRGKIKHVFEKRARVYDMDALARWRNRIVELLDNHLMMLPQQGVVVIIHLAGGANGEASAAISQADGPFAVVEPAPELPFDHPEQEQSPPE
jgi:hypothetical protein